MVKAASTPNWTWEPISLVASIRKPRQSPSVVKVTGRIRLRRLERVARSSSPSLARFLVEAGEVVDGVVHGDPRARHPTRAVDVLSVTPV